MNTDRTNDAYSDINISKVNAEIPRKVHFDSLSIKVLSGALLVFLGGCVALIWIFHNTAENLHMQQLLRREGRIAYGEIANSSVNDGGTYVRYTFSVDDMLYSGHAEMETDHYTVPGKSDKIPIRYLPSDPRVNQPIDWKWVSVWDLFPFLLLIVMTAAAANPLRIALRQIPLARKGIVVLGRVTGCAPNKKLFTVYYEFKAEGNMAVEGKCNLLDEYEVGTSIPVIYLNSNPRRNDRYPISGFRRAAPVPLIIPTPDEGAPGPSHLGTGDSENTE